MSSKPEDKVSEFEWIKLRTDMGGHETTREKLIRKMKENPVVPFGCLVTAVVLGMGLANFRKGDMAKSQKYMRLRVLAQGFTVAALMGGMVLAAWKPQEKNDK
ncbi:HIG1 domain family member 2A, mitochondrial [Ctenocephalides felis]|uniref:HIG1 domain family member 2A, mitochondrial n=1 Tax=Ctenocephalides felis TaxID=7515 RepID=UPI000E6E1923|nr:HIG1 domain family member 2A, mitochondrial [Ctenocephalides felis]